MTEVGKVFVFVCFFYFLESVWVTRWCSLARLFWAVWQTESTKWFLSHQTQTPSGTFSGLLWHGRWRRMDSVSETSAWEGWLQQVSEKEWSLMSLQPNIRVTRLNICLILIPGTGWITKMALVTSNSGMMSFGWGTSTCILCFQKVGND